MSSPSRHPRPNRGLWAAPLLLMASVVAVPVGAAGADEKLALAERALNEKMNAYVECINRLSERSYDSRSRYFSWAAKEGPTGKERIIYGTYTIYDTSDCKEAVEKANGLEPHDPGLEAAATAYVTAVVALEPLLEEADDYYEQEDYKDDGMAKGKALHPRLVAAWDAFAAADQKLRAGIEAIQDKRAVERLAEIEKTEGRKARFLVQALMMKAKRAVRLQTASTPDIAAITTAVGELEAITKETDAFARANKSSGIGSMFMSAAKETMTTSKLLMRRVRDKVPYSQGDQMMMGTDGGGWMVEGSPDRLLNDYNRLVESYNSGPDFGSTSADDDGASSGIAGKWESNKGPLTIAADGSGYLITFELDPGKIEGTIEGADLRGTWVMKEGQERCKSEKDGSPYWGGFKVTFHKGEMFQGQWYACETELKDGMRVENWTGARSK